ncbi:MAG: hypothetical protein ACE5EB_02280 [Thermodesulfobacteriota bacterium]
MKISSIFKVLFLTGLAVAVLSGGFLAGEAVASSNGPMVVAEAAPDGVVKINSPEDGAVIKDSSVVVSFEILNKGSRGDHVHLYLDGKLVKPLRGVKGEYTITGLTKGEHQLEIRLSTKGHHVLDIRDGVTITVE